MSIGTGPGRRAPGNGWRPKRLLAHLAVLLCASSLAFAQQIQMRPEDAPNGDYGGFWTWAEMVDKINEYTQRYPNLIHVSSIGKTYEGRDIPVVRLSNNARVDDTTRPELLLMAGIHPREQQPLTSVMRLMDDLITGYGSDEQITRLMDTRQIWLMPIYNLDGLVYDKQNGNGTTRGANWRITRRPHPSGRFGIDLNRNTLIRWGGAGRTAGGGTYQGARPHSEPETQALTNFISNREFRIFVDFHATMAALLYPAYLTETERARYKYLANGIRERQQGRPYRDTEVRVADTPNRRGGNTGVVREWAYYVDGAYGMNIEINLSGFYAAPEQVEREYVQRVRDPALFLIEAAGSLPRPQPGHVWMRNVTTSAPLTPDTTVQVLPQLEGEYEYAVLGSWSPEVEVTSEFRLAPVRNGFHVNVRPNAEPGTEVRLELFVWGENRQRNAIPITLEIAAEEPAMELLPMGAPALR